MSGTSSPSTRRSTSAMRAWAGSAATTAYTRRSSTATSPGTDGAAIASAIDLLRRPQPEARHQPPPPQPLADRAHDDRSQPGRERLRVVQRPQPIQRRHEAVLDDVVHLLVARKQPMRQPERHARVPPEQRLRAQDSPARAATTSAASVGPAPDLVGEALVTAMDPSACPDYLAELPRIA